MENELVELYQKTIPTQNLDLIPLEFLCDAFGLDFDRQYRNLDNDRTYAGMLSKVANEEVFGDKRKRGHLNKKGFVKWIMQMNPTYISESKRDIFIDYQNNIMDYIYDNAIQQESVLKLINVLKAEKNAVYISLMQNAPDFKKYIDLQAQIMRLGKDSKAIIKRIAGGEQKEFDFTDSDY